MNDDLRAKLQTVRTAVGTADWSLHEVLSLLHNWTPSLVVDDDEIPLLVAEPEEAAERFEIISDEAKSLSLNATERLVEARLQLKQALATLKALVESDQ